tara:strand:+ start:1398 stop:3338 length:1941 start_codon:yes stop_codon:yes gene_type:complete
MDLEKLVVRIEADLSDLKKGLDKANSQVKKSSTGMSKSFDSLGKSLDKIGRRVIKFGGLLGVAFGGVQIAKVVGVGRQIEDLQVRLKSLFRSADEGARAFDVMVKFASRVPFTLEQIQQASGSLAVVAKDADELAELLEITGNVAGATGLDFRVTSEQIQRSFSSSISSADLFRERGVKAMLGFQAGAEVSLTDTIRAFKEKFGKGGEFGGVTDDLANTLTGTLSMLQDKLFQFRKAIADEFMVVLKEQFQDLNQSLEDSSDKITEIGKDIGRTLGESLSAIAKNIDEVIFALKSFGLFLLTTAGVALFNFVKALGKVQVIIIALIGLFEAFRFIINGINEQIELGKKHYQKLAESIGLTNKELAQSIETNKRYQIILGSIPKLTKEVAKANDVVIVSQSQLKDITEEVGKSFDDSGKEISDALARSIVAGESFGDAFKNIFENLKIQIVSTIAQILIIEPLIRSLKEALTGLQGGDITLGSIGKSITGSTIGTALSGGLGTLAGTTTMSSVAGLNVGSQLLNAKGQVIGTQLAPTVVDNVGSGFLGAISSFLGAKDGGFVPPNKPVMVGERGAELLVPRTASNVVSNSDLGGGITVNQSLNFSTGIVPTVRSEIMNMLPTIKQETINAVAETRSRGGSFARTFGA